MKKLFSILAWSLVIGTLCFAGSAMADDPVETSEVWTTVTDRVLDVFQNSRRIIFIIGGFGLIGIAFAAIFGKVNWKWFAGLCVGLGIVAIAGLIVDYVTEENVDNPGVLTGAPQGVGSTFYNSETGTADFSGYDGYYDTSGT